jgi:DNA helicase HerA-like ATPase
MPAYFLAITMTEIKKTFAEEIRKGYSFNGLSIVLGGALLNSESVEDVLVRIPLKTLNRHGLIAGATGTGKTKTLQALAESLSEKGVPVLLMDIKGDLSGLGAKGELNASIKERHDRIGIPFHPQQYPVELLTISKEKGTRLRATVSEFGPVLFSRILGLNETQSGLVSLIFKFCDDERFPLLDLKDFKKVLQYIVNEGKQKIQETYGNVSSTSASTIVRKVIELEQQGAELFFGEKSFQVEDLIRSNEGGFGIISIVKLTDIQDKPKLFSTFMLSLLAEVYSSFPEQGDAEKPKLVVFIDEAHLIFDQATKTLTGQIETIIKLIRSKGVGIFFCTQNPSDIPAAVLGQLGLKIQHALRAFTPNDRKMIKTTAENYPFSDFYKTDDLLTSLGIGEAAVTVLNEKGSPTPLVATLLKAPQSRMGVLSLNEMENIASNSLLSQKYNADIDRESAYEMLSAKISSGTIEAVSEEEKTGSGHEPVKKEKNTFEQVIQSPLARQIGRTLVKELTRGLLGVLGVGGKNSSGSKKGGW